MAFGTPPAYMGFMGYVRFKFPSVNDVIIRATSADLRLSQDITKPDVIDGRFDKTVYQLGPQIVEGSVEYPAIMERSGRTDPTAQLYRAAIGRDVGIGARAGRLKSTYIFDTEVMYTTQFANFKYNQCIVNTWSFKAEQSGIVTINVGLLGRDREQAANTPLTTSSSGFPINARIVTWNDVTVGITGAVTVSSEYVRTFEATVNNDAERFYTFNGLLAPQDIAARKRDIDGSIVLLGRHPQLAEQAYTNQDRCYEVSQINFGYQLSRTECNSTFLVTYPNTIFEIEEMQLSNDIFETTVNWHVLPDDNDLEGSAYLTTAS